MKNPIGRALALAGFLAIVAAGCVQNRSKSAATLPAVHATTTAPPPSSLTRFEFTEAESEQLRVESQGDVAWDSVDPFIGDGSLRLSRGDASDSNKPVYVLTAPIPVEQGNYQIDLAIKSDLESPDNSFKGEVTVEYTDLNGRPAQVVSIAELDKKHAWTAIRKDISVPAQIASARFRVRIDKAAGSFWLGDLSIKPSTIASGDAVVDRIFFDTAQVGNLLFPTDKRTAKVIAWTLRELADSEREIDCVLTDYFGAEQAEPIKLTLKKTGMVREKLHVYEGTLDFASVPLEVGRYYEIHASLNKQSQGDQPAGVFRNYTSLAILPFAEANRYRPEEIPFTSRTWDGRIAVAQLLNYRLGLRVGGVWGGWSAQKPYEPYAPVIDVVEKQGMGFLSGAPSAEVEHRTPGYEKWTDEALRQGMRNFYARYGHIKPMIIDLGNEPSNKGDDVKINVAAYKSVYEEAKKLDPSIIVLATSCGANEDFFKAGFGEYCDAYDFHIYGDSGEVRDTIEKQYPAMFAKYGNKKPIWSTELGFSSHGMARLPVATEMVKKTVNFFAAGGANMSWFGIMYPDPDAQIVGTGGESHNVFDCRYEKYAPKLDAIMYYNLVNAIEVKKFVAEKTYDNGVKAFLFRDKEGNTLQVLYMDKGLVDIGVPLAGVEKVQVIRVDGSRSELTPTLGKITLTAGQDPLLLLYHGGAEQLAATLKTPTATIKAFPTSIVNGDRGTLEIEHLDIVKALPVYEIKLPFGWKNNSPATARSFDIISPASSNAREADVVAMIVGPNGTHSGELYRRAKITGAITSQLLPVPATSGGNPGVKLTVTNNGKAEQKISYAVAINSMKPPIEGEYPDKAIATDAFFTATPSGEITLAGRASQSVLLPMGKTEPHTVYFVKSVVKDASGREVIEERAVGGFVAVPKVASDAIKLDGVLDEPAWQKASVQRVDKAEQFFNFKQPNADKQWTGPQDLSADIRYAWDENNLYVAVSVTDDIAGKPQNEGMIWSQDGLQFLIDPTRTQAVKAGRYDYAVALSSRGPLAWNYLTADTAQTPSGEVKAIRSAIKRTDPANGNTIYEIAFPWAQLAPFKPAVGGDLGFTLIVNEDDGNGRDSFLTWFGNAHVKDISTVGDLILMGE